MRVLIAGYGDLGRAVARRLLAEGAMVHALNRSGDVGGLDDVVPMRADLGDPSTLAFSDAFDAVLLCATPSSRDAAGYQRVFIEGTRNLLAAIGPIRRCVFVSSTSVHGASDGRWIDERSPPDPVEFNGQVLAQAESVVQAAGGKVLRLAGIYGPGRERLRSRLMAEASSCRATPPWYTNRIHIDDAAALAACMLNAEHVPDCVIGVDQYPAPECEVLGWLADRLGLPAPSPIPHQDGSNKRLRSLGIEALGFALRYPDFRSGYSALYPA